VSGPVADPEKDPIIEAVPVKRPTVSDAPHRLHPLSWMFTLVSRLKVLVVPAVLVLVMRRGGLDASNWINDPLLWAPLLGGSGVGLASIWQYLTYRYGIGEDALVVRSGLLERSLRVIPFARIHNVGIEQTLLHRIFRVAKVRLESAGSERPEAEMEVLAIDDALALEALIRRRAGTVQKVAPATDVGSDQEVPPAGGDLGAQAGPATNVLFALSLKETLLLGLLSHRGFVAVGAAFGALASLPGDLFTRLITPAALRLSEQLAVNWVVLVLSALQALGIGYLAVKVLSVIVTLVQDFRFRLSEEERRLTTEKGLLSIIRASVSRRRIQSWTQRSTLFMRMMGRSTLSIDIASRQAGEEARHSVSTLIPLASPQTCASLVDHLLPGAGFSSLVFSSIPLGAWWRRAIGGLAFAMLVAGILLGFAIAGRLSFTWALLALLLLPWSLFRAYREAQEASWALTSQLVVIRSGWPTRIVRVAELDKLQALSINRSILDRRFGTATVHLDTAGAAPGTGLQLRYLPVDKAMTLHRHLAAELSRRPLRW